MFKGLAEEINRRIGERKLRSLSVNHLYLIGDVLEMLKNIQREIRRMFVVDTNQIKWYQERSSQNY